MAAFTGEARYEAHALKALRPMADLMGRYPTGFGRFLSALDWNVGPVAEVALVWPREDAAAPLLRQVFGRFLPNRVVAGRRADDAAAAAGIPLLADRGLVDGRATAYVCRNYACQLPVTEPEALARQLDEV
jgi:hypothetical protein